ncbi:MAG: hypothetical protein Q7R96_03535 [Nanoarchaeota archaeon]|nr:hypothetical protein [Nanoarchaeota archaeon]
MNKLFFSLSILCIFLIGCTTIEDTIKGGTLNQGTISGKRGILINFVPEKPPQTLETGQTFLLGLKTENYLPEKTAVQVTITPTLNIPTTTPLDQTFTVETTGAVYDEKNNKFIKLVKEITPADKTDAGGDISLGPYSLNPETAYGDQEFQLVVDYTYPVAVELKGRFCTADPSLIQKLSCKEQLQEKNLEGPARNIPITITSIEKKRQSATKETYRLGLVFHISDESQGNITKKGKDQQSLVHFTLTIPGIDMQCRQDKTQQKNSLLAATGFAPQDLNQQGTPGKTVDVTLAGGKATIVCSTELASKDKQDTTTAGQQPSQQEYEFTAHLDYAYNVQLLSKPITVTTP